MYKATVTLRDPHGGQRAGIGQHRRREVAIQAAIAELAFVAGGIDEGDTLVVESVEWEEG